MVAVVGIGGHIAVGVGLIKKKARIVVGVAPLPTVGISYRGKIVPSIGEGVSIALWIGYGNEIVVRIGAFKGTG
jgi:hypothetical protein